MHCSQLLTVQGIRTERNLYILWHKALYRNKSAGLSGLSSLTHQNKLTSPAVADVSGYGSSDIRQSFKIHKEIKLPKVVT